MATAKQDVQKVLEKLPDEASLEDIPLALRGRRVPELGEPAVRALTR